MDAEHTPTPAEQAALIQQAYDVAQARAQGGPGSAPPVLVIYDEAAEVLGPAAELLGPATPDRKTAAEALDELLDLVRRYEEDMLRNFPASLDGREWFPVTDPYADAPDGAVISYDGAYADPMHPDRHGFYQRSGDQWHPVELPEDAVARWAPENQGCEPPPQPC